MQRTIDYRMITTNISSDNIILEFTLPINSKVNFTVYDVTGRTVFTENTDQLNSGAHSLTWNRNDYRGQLVAAGSYFFRLEAGGNVATGKFIIAE